MEWAELLRRPADFTDGPAAERWFCRIAEALLNRAALRADGSSYRIVEAEAYYHCPGHDDPFTHRDPLQQYRGRWYFHRRQGTYRGGTFKGLDLTFGEPARASGGFLLRGLLSADGAIIDGPSLVVDSLLRETGFTTVAALAEAVGDLPAWDPEAPIRLTASDSPVSLPIFRTARVGLSLKARRPGPDDPAIRFVPRRYRFLTNPRRTKKGKPLMVLALHADGMAEGDIAARTGCPISSVRRYVAAFAAGEREADPSWYFGRKWSTADLCRFHGLLWRRQIG